MNDPMTPNTTRACAPPGPAGTHAGGTSQQPAPRRPRGSYPLTPPRATDRRFTVELVRDIAATICRHGYPPFAGADVLHLRNRLYTIIYRTHQWEDNL
jgi:hypothetical protein